MSTAAVSRVSRTVVVHPTPTDSGRSPRAAELMAAVALVRPLISVGVISRPACHSVHNVPGASTGSADGNDGGTQWPETVPRPIGLTSQGMPASSNSCSFLARRGHQISP